MTIFTLLINVMKIDDFKSVNSLLTLGTYLQEKRTKQEVSNYISVLFNNNYVNKRLRSIFFRCTKKELPIMIEAIECFKKFFPEGNK